MNKRRKSHKAKKLATYYYNKDNFRKALDNYLRTVSFKNETQYFSEKNHHLIGYCYFELGDIGKALEYAQKCFSMANGYIDGKKFYGDMLIESGNKKEGEKILEECNIEEERIKNTTLDLDTFYNLK